MFIQIFTIIILIIILSFNENGSEIKVLLPRVEHQLCLESCMVLKQLIHVLNMAQIEVRQTPIEVCIKVCLKIVVQRISQQQPTQHDVYRLRYTRQQDWWFTGLFEKKNYNIIFVVYQIILLLDYIYRFGKGWVVLVYTSGGILYCIYYIQIQQGKQYNGVNRQILGNSDLGLDMLILLGRQSYYVYTRCMEYISLYFQVIVYTWV
eukprot:TRINITY_DN17375_c0_g1_i4.p6 TRINITY_DN17375_c0_g1~~TRINITY_DN17375_c0_g1_i4.p6  ORF type:complete len:206 (-),score=-1.99 TRINITY_DN17375_c0_g1_i4:415-1032(-)